MTSNHKDNSCSLNVVLLSIPQRTASVLEFFFHSTGSKTFASSTEESADAAIFDYDNPMSREHWKRYHEKTGKPGILLSVTEHDDIAAIWVNKPLTPKSMFAAAEKVCELLTLGIDEMSKRRQARSNSAHDKAQNQQAQNVVGQQFLKQPTRTSVSSETTRSYTHTEKSSNHTAHLQAQLERLKAGTSSPQPQNKVAAQPAEPEVSIGTGLKAGTQTTAQIQEAQEKQTEKPVVESEKVQEPVVEEPVTLSEEDIFYCGKRDDVPVDRITKEPDLFYTTENYLVSHLNEAWQTAKKWKRPVQVELYDHMIILMPNESKVYSSFTMEELRDFCGRPLSRMHFKFHLLGEKDFSNMQELLQEKATENTFEYFLWDVSLGSAHGRLPVGTAIDQNLYLRYWPNLTRVYRIPHAIQISALWATRGASLAETAKLLGIPQRYVFSFYNAVTALDLITYDDAHLKRRPIVEKSDKKERGFFSRLLRRLRGKKE